MTIRWTIPDGSAGVVAGTADWVHSPQVRTGVQLRRHHKVIGGAPTGCVLWREYVAEICRDIEGKEGSVGYDWQT
jgi:hypothetical protein